MYDAPTFTYDVGRYKFTGKERDAESGLDNFPKRYLTSSMGRWMSPDPLPWLDWQHGNREEREHFADFISNPQNFNMYAYVDNNPVRRVAHPFQVENVDILGCPTLSRLLRKGGP